MLDVMSGGRMEYAFPLGTGMEYWANEGTVNPATARARFRESLDIILKAWTEDGPTRYDGDFYTYRYLNVWPKPYQKPRPKCFIVGTGSEETVELAVDYDMGYSIVFVPIPNQLRAFARLRELADERGETVDPDDLIIVVMAYVADTDEEAVREARPHIENFFSWFHRVPPSSSCRPATSRPRSSCAACPTPRWRRAPRRPGTTWSPSAGSRAARPTPWPRRSSSGARRRAAGGSTSCSRTATCPSGRSGRTRRCSPTR